MKPFDTSIHNKVEIVIEIRIIRPPIVGVPFLVSRCDAGPSLRIGWPLPCFERSQAMNFGPISSAMTSAVITAAPLRKVM